MLSISTILLCIVCISTVVAKSESTRLQYGRLLPLILRVQVLLKCEDKKPIKYNLDVGYESLNTSQFVKICGIYKGYSNLVEECDGYAMYSRKTEAVVFKFTEVESCGCKHRNCEWQRANHTIRLAEQTRIVGLYIDQEVDFVLRWDMMKYAHTMDIYALHRKSYHSAYVPCLFYVDGTEGSKPVRFQPDDTLANDFFPSVINFRNLPRNCHIVDLRCRDVHIFFKLNISSCPNEDMPKDSKLTVKLLLRDTSTITKRQPPKIFPVLCAITNADYNGSYYCSGRFRYDLPRDRTMTYLYTSSLTIAFNNLHECYSMTAKEVNTFNDTVQFFFDLDKHSLYSKFNGLISIEMDWDLTQKFPDITVYTDESNMKYGVPYLIMQGSGQEDVRRETNIMRFVKHEQMLMHPAPFNTTFLKISNDVDYLYDDGQSPNPAPLATQPERNHSSPPKPFRPYSTPKPQSKPQTPRPLNPTATSPKTVEKTKKAPNAPEISEPETTPEVEGDAVTELHDSEVEEPRADAQTSGDDAAEDSTCYNHFNIFCMALIFFL